jgi:hypothetical protein
VRATTVQRSTAKLQRSTCTGLDTDTVRCSCRWCRCRACMGVQISTKDRRLWTLGMCVRRSTYFPRTHIPMHLSRARAERRGKPVGEQSVETGSSSTKRLPEPTIVGRHARNRWYWHCLLSSSPWCEVKSAEARSAIHPTLSFYFFFFFFFFSLFLQQSMEYFSSHSFFNRVWSTFLLTLSSTEYGVQQGESVLLPPRSKASDKGSRDQEPL